MSPRIALARAALATAAAAAVVALALAVAVWPAATALVLVVLAVLLAAWRAPELALVGALGLFGAEGSVKVLLTDGGPFRSNPQAVGAALLDLALFGTVAIILIRDRGRTPRALWSALSRPERVALGALVAWLVWSFAQIPQGGVHRGVAAFRLTQAYILCLPAALVVFSEPQRARRAAVALLGVLGLIAGYGALRAVIGPAAAESAFALRRGTLPYGANLRDVGSFSGAVGLESYLTPAVAFAVVAGWLEPRWRAPAWAVGGLGLLALLDSYGRTPLIAIAAAMLLAGSLVIIGGRTTAMRRIAVGAALLLLLATLAGGTVIASSGSRVLRSRASGIVDPAQDTSFQQRLAVWGGVLRAARTHPLGQGLGSVDSRAATTAAAGTTDNTYLKILAEQGWVVAVLFAGGLLGTLALLARRALRVPPSGRPLCVAAITGLAASLVLWVTTDDIEQPGKVLTWSLLGLALAEATRSRARPAGSQQS